MSSMFWGLRMESGKRYSTTVDKSFHISMATLDPQSVSSDEKITTVILEESEDGGSFFLTCLRRKDQLVSHLDLNFMTGDKVTLYCQGEGNVHLSGYMVPDDDDLSTTMLDDEAEEEEEEEVDEEEADESIIKSIKGAMVGKKSGKNEVRMKRLLEAENSKNAKKKKLELQKPQIEEDSDEDSNEDDDLKDLMDEDNDSDEEEDQDEEEAEDEEEEEEKEDVKVPPKKQKNKKNKQNQSNTSFVKTPNGVTSPQQKQGQKDDTRKSIEGVKQNQQQNKQGETTLSGGVKVKDVRVGNGAPCKPGKNVAVYYTGRLKSNGKVFDSAVQGPGFRFKIGKGEVIKGWDIGVVGMKVGGKRIITCPPQVAYGQKGAPPQIPPNSTLVFEVELKNVN